MVYNKINVQAYFQWKISIKLFCPDRSCENRQGRIDAIVSPQIVVEVEKLAENVQLLLHYHV